MNLKDNFDNLNNLAETDICAVNVILDYDFHYKDANHFFIEILNKLFRQYIVYYYKIMILLKGEWQGVETGRVKQEFSEFY